MANDSGRQAGAYQSGEVLCDLSTEGGKLAERWNNRWGRVCSRKIAEGYLKGELELQIAFMAHGGYQCALIRAASPTVGREFVEFDASHCGATNFMEVGAPSEHSEAAVLPLPVEFVKGKERIVPSRVRFEFKYPLLIGGMQPTNLFEGSWIGETCFAIDDRKVSVGWINGPVGFCQRHSHVIEAASLRLEDRVDAGAQRLCDGFMPLKIEQGPVLGLRLGSDRAWICVGESDELSIEDIYLSIRPI